MNLFCLSCRVPLGRADTHCPACGAVGGGDGVEPPRRVVISAAPVNDGPRTEVPGRVVTGTVVRFATVRQERFVSVNFLRAARIGAVLAGLSAVGAVASGAPFVELLPVLGGAAALQLVLGVVLRSSLSRVDRRSAGGPCWPWTLPLRDVALARTEAVSSMVVKDVEGGEHTCTARGRYKPGDPAAGTVVEVYGRRDKAGDVLVRHLVPAGDGDVLVPRVPFAARLGRAVECAAAVAWTGTALALSVISM